MRKIIFSLVLVFGLVGSLFAQSIEESNRRENLFSTFYSYVDDLNENYKKDAETKKIIRQSYIDALHSKKVELLLEGKPTDEIDAKLKDLVELDKEAPVQIKIKSIEYSSDVVWEEPTCVYTKKLNNVYECELVVNKENLGPSLVSLCAVLYDFFDDTNWQEEEEIPGVSNEDLRECYNLVDIAVNYFSDLLSYEEGALIRQYCIDKVGLEVYKMIWEDL